MRLAMPVLGIVTVALGASALAAVVQPGFGPGGSKPGVQGVATVAPSVSVQPQAKALARAASPSPSRTPKPAGGPRPGTKRTHTPPPKAAAATEIASSGACPGQTDTAQTAKVIVCLASHARRFHGLPVVASQPQLVAAATSKAGDIVTCRQFSHTACSREAHYWIEAEGYGGMCLAENIAQGQKTPRDVFIAWMKSPGHRANILNPRYTQVGVAARAETPGPTWVMELGGCLL